MKKICAKLLPFFFLLSFGKICWSGPWLTGPLLAPAGHTVPKGHTNLEWYGFLNYSHGAYDENWHFMSLSHRTTQVMNPVFSHGLTDKLDIQYSVPYVFTKKNNAKSNGFGDVSFGFGYQLLEQNDSHWRPDLRLTVQEILPSGKYLDLDPGNNGADSRGLGSYQTAINFNFQHLLQLTDVNYFRTRLSLGYVFASTVNIHGFNSYGGNDQTKGRIQPGNLANIDLATEFTITQHWVAVMETYASTRHATSFLGTPGLDDSGDGLFIGQGNSNQVTLAPAIEYNFSGNIGLIGGVWFTVAGRDSSQFTTAVIALNAYY